MKVSYKINQSTLNAIRDDSLKWGTMFLIVRMLEMGNLADMDWIKESILVLIGFATYHLTFGTFLDTSGLSNKLAEVADIALKFGTMIIVAHLLAGGKVNNAKLTSVGYELVGYSLGAAFLNDLAQLNNFQGRSKKLMSDVLFFGGHAFFLQVMQGNNITDPGFLRDLTLLLMGFSTYTVFVQ